MSENGKSLLSVRDLRTYFYTDAGVSRAVDGVSFEIAPGTTLAVVGESGCGKSVTALSVLRLVADPPGKIVSGEIHFNGRNLLDLSAVEMRAVRGNDISMIFQEPMTSLNPVFRIGRQIGAVIQLHRGVDKQEAERQTIALLRKVGIPSPDERVNDYPHQMSGGMRQRVMIAMALACEPKLLIADEPTTALDVTIQAQILELLKALQREFGMSIMLITHDLGVVAENADEVVIMYAGQIVERAPVEALFETPKHPYTVLLMRSLPQVGAGRDRLETIRGQVPPATDFSEGCRFHPRCPYAMAVCRSRPPDFEPVGEKHEVSCWLYDQETMRAAGRPTGFI